MDLTGRKVFYRPLHEKEMKSATVISTQKYEKVLGDGDFTLLTLDNGDSVGVSECYVEVPID